MWQDDLIGVCPIRQCLHAQDPVRVKHLISLVCLEEMYHHHHQLLPDILSALTK